MMAKSRLQSPGTLLASIVLLISCYLYSTGNIQGISRSFMKLLSPPFECENPNYTVRLLSYDPLMIHIENFLTLKERKYLIKLTSARLKRSKVKAMNGTAILSEIRTSKTASIPSIDPIANCVLQRVSEFQGYEPLQNIETMQVTSYQQTEEFRDHFDWHGAAYMRERNITTDRLTTFFGILEADCENCDTQFTYLGTDWQSKDDRWCQIVNCTAEQLRVKPLPGSALFWRNLHLDGKGDSRTRHAGLPLSRGVKVGLNIWTTEDFGDRV